MSEPLDRRPIAARDTGLARKVTTWLVRRNLTPNAISAASMLFALLGGLAFGLLPHSIAGLILAAFGCQMRLLCNLIDGLVAVEGGKGAADGPFWNEAPDRISDMLILIGMGVGVGMPELGMMAALFAVLTAYTRELGRANGVGNDFSGPFAKPQRMALATVAALLQAIVYIANLDWPVLVWALWVIVCGTGFTILRRAWRQIQALKARS